MKEEEIRDILNSHQICFAQHGTLCATVKAGIGAYQNGLGEIMHTMKDHILHINAQEHTLLFLPHEDIVSTTIKIKLLHFLFTIETRKGTIVYKLHKNVLASPWHKENLSFLLLNSPSA